jgi:hypothetical protein
MHVNDCLLHLNGFAPTQCGGSGELTLETVSIVFDRIWADIELRMNDILFCFRKSILLKLDFTEDKPMEMFFVTKRFWAKRKKNMFYLYRYPKQRRDIMN